MPELLSRLQAALTARYRIDREIGSGGMATVYLAQDLRHDRRVALKVLRPELAAVIGAERFLAEIRLTANLQHPHILPLFDSGEADGYLFYVMPFVEGETLRDRLTREKQLPVADALPARSPRRSTTLTVTTSCIGTSSRRTSCSMTARLSSRTSASRSRPARRAPG
jgi:serine/threonine protein kinase